jgi:hypothetical protein
MGWECSRREANEPPSWVVGRSNTELISTSIPARMYRKTREVQFSLEVNSEHGRDLVGARKVNAVPNYGANSPRSRTTELLTVIARVRTRIL